VVLDDDDSGELAAEIDADEHRDRAAIAALEWQQLGRPERIAEDRLAAAAACVGGVMRRVAFLR
jgi:hypothetical protein